MKKLLAILTALALLVSCFAALADESGDVLYQGIDFDITVDVPEGYTMQPQYISSLIIADFVPDDPAKVNYHLGVIYDDEYDKDFVLNDLSDEEFEATAQELMAEYAYDFCDPTTEVRTTGMGTKLLLIDENGSESEYAILLTIYHGYFIELDMDKADNVQITEEELQTGIDILTSLWMVPMTSAGEPAAEADPDSVLEAGPVLDLETAE